MINTDARLCKTAGMAARTLAAAAIAALAIGTFAVASDAADAPGTTSAVTGICNHFRVDVTSDHVARVVLRDDSDRRIIGYASPDATLTLRYRYPDPLQPPIDAFLGIAHDWTLRVDGQFVEKFTVYSDVSPASPSCTP